jgi:TolB-like protein
MNSRRYPISTVAAAPNFSGYGVIMLQLACQLVLAIILIGAISGCSKRYDDMPAYLPIDFGDFDNQSVGRFKTAFLADQIDTFYRGVSPGPIGITTFVNLDDLYKTSTFGRVLSEQLMSELTMRGFDVIELRQSDALQFIDADGEFALSRQPGMTRRSRELGGIVVGTYVASSNRVYINTRVIDPSTALIVSSGSAEMSKSKEIARLLRGGLPASLERIPVRHLGLSQVPMNMGNSYNSVYDLEESLPQAPAKNAAAPEFGEASKSKKK